MKYLIPVFVLVCLMTPLFVEAMIDCARAGLPGPNTIRICNLINRIENIVFIFGLSLAIIVIIIGGITYMTAGADEGKVGNARKILLYGIIGVAIILLASFIVNLLDEIVISSLGGSPAPIY